VTTALLAAALVPARPAVAAASATSSGTSSGSVGRCTVTAADAPTCGRWWGEALDTDGRLLTSAVAASQEATGRRLDIVHTYHRWDDPFPTAGEAQLAHSGHLLLVGWKPVTLAGTPVSWASIASGAEDGVITAEAVRLRDLGVPVLLSFSYEPEKLIGVDGTAPQFAAAWRHIHDVMVAAGATNIRWVWTVMGLDSTYWHQAYQQLWPGPGYVDWIAWDPYNWSSCRHDASVTFAQMVRPFYTWVTAQQFGTQPLMLAEYGTVERTGVPGRKAAWFAGETKALAAFPRLAALVYFDLPAPPASCDWLTTTSPGSAAAFTALARSGPFRASARLHPDGALPG
jgi:hypothetical protein